MSKRTKKAVFIVIWVIVAAVLLRLFFLSFDVLGIWQKRGSVTVTVDAGKTGAYQVGQTLKDAGVIESPLVFSLVAKMKGADAKLHAGTYTLDASKGYNFYINTFAYDYTYRTTNITIPEGSTLADIKRIIVSTGYVSDAEFEAALEAEYDYDFLKGVDRDNPLEGYLFPDTYNISNTMSAEDMVDMMLRRFEEVFVQKYSDRAKKLGYSDDEIMILASIIECEAGSGNDRTKVSSVFHNRLNRPSTYPYLQSCATVQYVLGEKKPILSIEDTKIDSPYNTYIHKGLPIGPICNPGKAAIEAALYPADTDYLYFQSDSAGKIYYATTLQEHEAIKQKIQ